MVEWKKLGLVYEVNKRSLWMKSHAQVPTVLVLDKVLRVYFSGRPEKTISLTGFVDLDKSNLSQIVYESERPILELGEPGTFDEFGIMPSTVVKNDDGRVFLYYTGWSRGTTVPYLNAIGLAVSEDDGHTFHRYSKGPVVERRMHEPFSAMSPYVLKEGNVWHMWYSSGVDWFKGKEKLEPIYIIKYARSTDGINWDQTGFVSIHPKNPLEAATRASVLWREGMYHMWYCFRGSKDYRGGNDSYRIGYATSPDAVNWERHDGRAGIAASNEGWDSVMIEYPQIVKLGSKLVMFYNGNGFGEDGFGVATADLNGKRN
jgi:predicted GH43/DUF377 family glycosyl hydrolase